MKNTEKKNSAPLTETERLRCVKDGEINIYDADEVFLTREEAEAKLKEGVQG